MGFDDAANRSAFVDAAIRVLRRRGDVIGGKGGENEIRGNVVGSRLCIGGGVRREGSAHGGRCGRSGVK